MTIQLENELWEAADQLRAMQREALIKLGIQGIVMPDRSTRAALELAVGALFEQQQTLIAANAALAQARHRLLLKLMSGQLDVSGIPLPQGAAV
jgi:hypothetical protein